MFGLSYARIRLLCELRAVGPSVLRIFHPEWAMSSGEGPVARGVALGSTRIRVVPRKQPKRLIFMVSQAWYQLLREITGLFPVAGRREKP